MATCSAGKPLILRIDDHSSREDLVAARQSVIDFVVSTNSYAVCLYSALAVLKAEFAKSGHAVDPVVEAAVAEAIDETTTPKVEYVTSFNTAADYYNRQRSTGASDRIEPLDITLVPPPPDSRVALPPGAGLLSMPMHAVGSTHDCEAFFPRAVRIHHRGGSATIGYDVAADGSIANAYVISSAGLAEADDAALACVATQWRDTPAIRDGIPFATTGYVVTISFATSHRVGN